MENIKFKKQIPIILSIFCCLLMFACPDGPVVPGDEGSGDDTEDETDDQLDDVVEKDFTLISDSGTMILRVSGLTTGSPDAGGAMIFYGATGLQSGGLERIGDSIIVDENTESLVMSNEGSEYIFTGGEIITYLGCVIDINYSETMDDGDYIGGAAAVEAESGKIIDLVYPDDFDVISDSSSADLHMTGLTSGSPDLTGRLIFYGATGIISGQFERIGAQTSVSADEMTLTFTDGESPFIFNGGEVIPFMGCIIDANNNGEPDDGDYMGGDTNVTAGTGAVVNLGFPDDFTQISGSGKITLHITGLAPQIGHDIMFGASGISSGPNERIGHSLTIDSDTMDLVLAMDGTDYTFIGGSTVKMAGCIIDVNGNSEADNGDYMGGASDITVDGNMTISLQFDP